eukprot:TRINITY_DN5765_c2_g1_i1.p3 TRINITY_DN5765_c2_g1~~TRINITY_DN5765_c2_g1_i1.p3  ORF type:complete len:354 (-),score=11.79 TRINITY_DN5765_c2_g1_i1:281-1342(-)
MIQLFSNFYYQHEIYINNNYYMIKDNFIIQQKKLSKKSGDVEKDLKPDDRKILDLIDTSFHSNADQNKQLISQQISKPRKEDLVLFRDNFFAAQKMRLDANDKYKSKQYDQALNLYDQIIKQYGKFLHPKMVAQLCLQKGSILFKQNLYILSASEFLKSIALDPKFFEAYREIAAVYTQLRLHEMAQEMYQRIGNQPEASRNASMKRQQSTPNMFLILNLPQQCTDREVERAYRKLALNIHPDKIQSSCPFSTSLCQQGCLQQVQQNVIFERLKSEFRNLFSQLSQAKDRLTTQTQIQSIVFNWFLLILSKVYIWQFPAEYVQIYIFTYIYTLLYYLNVLQQYFLYFLLRNHL